MIERSTCVSAAKVDDRVAALAGACDGDAVDEVAVNELMVDVLDVGEVAAVRQLVQDDDVVALRREPTGEMAPDKARAVGDNTRTRE
jgi:hypothetical protein